MSSGKRPPYCLTPPRDSGHTLVFIHGWLLSHHYWQPLISHLEQDFQCLTYDLRGFGDHREEWSRSSQTYTPAAYAQDLGELLVYLNLSRVWLIGHSLGGTIALWGASLFPERVAGVICLNSGGGIYLQEEFERFRTFGQQLVVCRPPWLGCVPGLAWAFSRFAVAQPLDLVWGQYRFQDFLRADRAAALGALLSSTTEQEVHHLPQLVAQLKQPTYFIGGDRDPIMEPQYVRHLASFHPLFQSHGGNWLELSPCGHFAMLEQTEAVVNYIQHCLQANPLKFIIHNS